MAGLWKDPFDEFNPGKDFCLMFGLKIETAPKNWENAAMLNMVWRAPLLPRPGEVLHIGRIHDFVVKMPVARRGRPWLRTDASWTDDRVASLDAHLLHMKSIPEVVERFEALLAAAPEYRARLHLGLYTLTLSDADELALTR